MKFERWKSILVDFQVRSLTVVSRWFGESWVLNMAMEDCRFCSSDKSAQDLWATKNLTLNVVLLSESMEMYWLFLESPEIVSEGAPIEFEAR